MWRVQASGPSTSSEGEFLISIIPTKQGAYLPSANVTGATNALKLTRAFKGIMWT